MKIIFDNSSGSGGGSSNDRTGSAAIAGSASSTSVVFSSPLPDTNYALVTSITDTVDAGPIYLQIVATTKTAAGFTVTYNAPADSANYLLEYVAVPHA